jgi:hypothetical protein
MQGDYQTVPPKWFPCFESAQPRSDSVKPASQPVTL